MFFPHVTGKVITWDSTDAGVLRAFLETPVGEKTLRILQDRIPMLLDGKNYTTPTEILVRSGEVKGARHIFDSLISLVLEPPAELQPTPQSKDNYADLDDERHWDGVNPK